MENDHLGANGGVEDLHRQIVLHRQGRGLARGVADLLDQQAGLVEAIGGGRDPASQFGHQQGGKILPRGRVDVQIADLHHASQQDEGAGGRKVEAVGYFAGGQGMLLVPKTFQDADRSFE